MSMGRRHFEVKIFENGRAGKRHCDFDLEFFLVKWSKRDWVWRERKEGIYKLPSRLHSWDSSAVDFWNLLSFTQLIEWHLPHFGSAPASTAVATIFDYRRETGWLNHSSETFDCQDLDFERREGREPLSVFRRIFDKVRKQCVCREGEANKTNEGIYTPSRISVHMIVSPLFYLGISVLSPPHSSHQIKTLSILRHAKQPMLRHAPFFRHSRSDKRSFENGRGWERASYVPWWHSCAYTPLGLYHLEAWTPRNSWKNQSVIV